MRILLIDDDRLIARTIRFGWPEPGDVIDVCQSFDQARPIVLSVRLDGYDCLILDLHLPDSKGSAILSEVRSRSDVPVIMLSGSGDADFRADLLGAGASDYVMKPVGVRELHARVVNLVRNTRRNAPGASPSPALRLGSVTFEPHTRRLKRQACIIEMTQAESRLLQLLFEAEGRAVSRDDLYRGAFGRPFRDGEKVLETYIGRLRSKLQDLDDAAAALLITVRGIGYRLVRDGPYPERDTDPGTAGHGS